MNLTLVVEELQQDLQGLGGLGDERAAHIAERLAEALGSRLRLKVYDLLAQAAVELTAQLPAGHVEVRLAGQEPELVFVEDAPAGAAGTAGEELSARISLRLPESLKAAVEAAAAAEAISTNAWLVRALTRQIESRPARSTGRRLMGYARS